MKTETDQSNPVDATELSEESIELIDWMLDGFDWEKVIRVMTALDWKWHNDDVEGLPKYSVPTFNRLRSSAKKLLISAMKAPKSDGDGVPYTIYGGGLRVEAYGPTDVELLFVVEYADSAEGFTPSVK